LEPALDGLLEFLAAALEGGLILLLCLFLVCIRFLFPRRTALRIRWRLRPLRFGRKVGIEGAECGVIHGLGEERKDGKELPALLRKGL